MAKPHAIHHITIVVKDLDAAVSRYRLALGFDEEIRGDLPERGVRTARFLLGESWLVLVQPSREDSVPGRHLREHGEGVFLVSLAVDDLDEAAALVTVSGARMKDSGSRLGLDDWRIRDLAPDDFHGVPLQFTEAEQD